MCPTADFLNLFQKENTKAKIYQGELKIVITQDKTELIKTTITDGLVKICEIRVTFLILMKSF